jgi:hypothetical protein
MVQHFIILLGFIYYKMITPPTKINHSSTIGEEKKWEREEER